MKSTAIALVSLFLFLSIPTHLKTVSAEASSQEVCVDFGSKAAGDSVNGLGAVHPLEPFSLVFLDPPYGKGLAEEALTSAREGRWITKDNLIVVEEAAEAGFKAPQGFEELERRRYDDTEFVFLRSLPPE